MDHDERCEAVSTNQTSRSCHVTKTLWRRSNTATRERSRPSRLARGTARSGPHNENRARSPTSDWLRTACSGPSLSRVTGRTSATSRRCSNTTIATRAPGFGSTWNDSFVPVFRLTLRRGQSTDTAWKTRPARDVIIWVRLWLRRVLWRRVHCRTLTDIRRSTTDDVWWGKGAGPVF